MPKQSITTTIVASPGSITYPPKATGRPSDQIVWTLSGTNWSFDSVGLECDLNPPSGFGFTPWPADASQPQPGPGPNQYNVALPPTSARVTYKYAIRLKDDAGHTAVLDPDIENNPGGMP